MTILLTRQVVTTMLAWLEAQIPAEIERYLTDQPAADGLPAIAQYLDAEPTPLPEMASTPALMLLATDIIPDLEDPGTLQTYHPMIAYLIHSGMDEHTVRFQLYDYVAVLLRLIARTRNGFTPAPAGMQLYLGANPGGGKVASYSPTYSPREHDFYADAWVGVTALVSEYLP